MTVYSNIEKSLVGTRRTLASVCKEEGVNILDIEPMNLMVTNCSSCGIWHRSESIIDDLDSNPICRYCEDLIGL